MPRSSLLDRLKRYHKRLNGCSTEYDLTPYHPLLVSIRARQSKLVGLEDSRLRGISEDLRRKICDAGPGDDYLVEAFAIVAEAIKRVLNLEPYDEQIIGGIALARGKLVEMQTGEGKTLTAVFPAFYRSLSGAGVHILTFNDYLARRDAIWMAPVYEFLGLRVGSIQEGQPSDDRRIAYNADITYLTAKEAGFDYLRDSLCQDPESTVQRNFSFAIVDEADSILVDEARVPLIIAGSFDDHVAGVQDMTPIAQALMPDRDFEFDTYARNVYLTEEGIQRAENTLGCGNLYDAPNLSLLARLEHALHAQHLLHVDKDYIVRDGTVELIDEFTGRVADKRRWPDGLQAAVEAKENCSIQSRGRILNTIPLQHFLRSYPQISGMTATAQPAEEELREFFALDITVVPPHQACIREDLPDRIYATREDKHAALIEEISRVHATRRPVLVGTQSVKESVTLTEMLRERGIVCEVLNAKNDEQEAGIIAQAGKPGAVTISTNMAGRGTDIRLGGPDETGRSEVIGLGGLYVIGTNRHESRRIDNQLRGRAGRQGDPGSSCFFVSLEDSLFVKYRLKTLLPPKFILGGREGVIDDPVVSTEINRLQRIIEGQDLEIKITLYKYSHLVEQQRRVLHARRQDARTGSAAGVFCRQHAPEHHRRLQQAVGSDRLAAICRRIMLHTLDTCWSGYLANIADVRENIHLRRIGGQDPLFEFHKLSIGIFEQVQRDIETAAIEVFTKISPNGNDLSAFLAGLKAPSATWTYLVNDNPFEHAFGLQMAGNMGFSAVAGVYWPITMLYLFARRLTRKK